MKITVYLIFLLLLCSCAGTQRVADVQSSKNNVEEIEMKNHIVYLEVPKGFRRLNVSGDHREIEKQYRYADSSKIYISDFTTSDLNYQNIMQLRDSIANKRFEDIALNAMIAKELGKKYTPETLILQGKTDKGLYWKDIRIEYMSIGYVNVSKNRKDEFDKVLASFKLEN